MISSIKKQSFYIIYILLLGLVYFNYVFYVGFSPGDDSFHINFVKENPKIIDNIIENFIISPARVISGIMIGIFHPILTDNYIFLI